MAEITIVEIAKRCGVGVSTVSRALNNHSDINPETKKRKKISILGAPVRRQVRLVKFLPADVVMDTWCRQQGKE